MNTIVIKLIIPIYYFKKTQSLVTWINLQSSLSMSVVRVTLVPKAKLYLYIYVYK